MPMPNRKDDSDSEDKKVNTAVSASELQKLESLLELADLLSRQNDFQEILRVVAQKAASLLIKSPIAVYCSTRSFINLNFPKEFIILFQSW